MISRRDDETRANRHVEEKSRRRSCRGSSIAKQSGQRRNQPFFSFPTGGRIQASFFVACRERCV